MVAGAAAGAIGVLLFAAGALAIGDLPAFDATGEEIASHLDRNRTRIQIGAALDALAAPFLVWFLATVVQVASARSPAAGRAATVAFGCGLAYVAVFLIDISALAVGALRPENMAAAPELARALRDLEWIAIGIATPLGTAMLAAFAALALRDRAVWPRWVGRLAVLAAGAYLLRIGTVFIDRGAFAADGVLGLYLPVAAFAAWILTASVVLAIGSRSWTSSSS
jgi:hypothetical protein